MPSENLKTTYLTNLDATPQVFNSVGEGAPGTVRLVDGSITVTDAKTLGSIYQLLRIPSNAKIKTVEVGVDATVTTLTADIGLYYSDNPLDGTKAANATSPPTLVNSTTGGRLFGAAVDLKTAGLTRQIGNMTAAKYTQPAWQAAGLTSDPGGFFDLCLTTTATNSGAAVVYGRCAYIQ